MLMSRGKEFVLSGWYMRWGLKFFRTLIFHTKGLDSHAEQGYTRTTQYNTAQGWLRLLSCSKTAYYVRDGWPSGLTRVLYPVRFGIFVLRTAGGRAWRSSQSHGRRRRWWRRSKTCVTRWGDSVPNVLLWKDKQHRITSDYTVKKGDKSYGFYIIKENSRFCFNHSTSFYSVSYNVYTRDRVCWWRCGRD